MPNPCLQTNHSDFRGYPFEEFTEVKTRQFQKNNCSSGLSGSWVTYSKTYTSYISEDDLQNQIYSDEANFNSEGQANANANGTCSASCQTTLLSPYSYRPISVNSTNVWVNLVQPYTKIEFTTPGILPSKNMLINNVDVGGSDSTTSSVTTMWPHNNANKYYVFNHMRSSISPGSPIRLVIFDTTSNPCVSYEFNSIIYQTLQSGNHYVPHSLVQVLPSGILFCVCYEGTSGGASGFDICWYNFASGITSLIKYVNRPDNYRYKPFRHDMVYDGTDAYIMFSFASRANQRRTRTGIFKIGNVGTSNTFDIVQSFDFSNQYLKGLFGVHAGSRLFFVYREDGKWKVAPIYGATPAVPPNSLYNTEYKFIRDVSNTSIAYGGGGGRKSATYNSSTNSWVVING